MFSWLKKNAAKTPEPAEKETKETEPKPAGQKPAASKPAEPKTPAAETKDGAEEFLDDVTFIQDMKKLMAGPWYQYDILLAARPYGWGYMLSTLDYIAGADLFNISEVVTGEMNMPKTSNIAETFNKGGCKCAAVEELKTERGMLSAAGVSKEIGPVKIVWINQTRVLRFFTMFDDSVKIEKYAETLIRRTFGTENAMKRGKPIPPKG